MIIIHFPSGQQITIPGASEFLTETGMRIEFSTNDIVRRRVLKLSRNEKYEALLQWVPTALKLCKGDKTKLAQMARDAGYYSQTSGDMQLLWTVLEHLKKEVA